MLDEKTDCLTRFLAGPYNKFIYKYRYILIAALVIYGVVSAGIASQMGPLTKGETMLPAEHPLIQTQNIMLNEFKVGLGGPSTLSVSITWGIKEVKRENMKQWDASDMGELIWDD